MLSRAASLLVRRGAGSALNPTLVSLARSTSVSSNAQRVPLTQLRAFSTVEEVVTADDAWKKSCYVEIDYTIPEDDTVYSAVQRFSAYNIGCLVTTDADGKISGVVSERDYLSKIALLGRTSKDTKIKEISTKSANLITATPSDSVHDCMNKMLQKDIRHLPLLDDEGKVVGMLSIKDLVKAELQEKEKTIKVLSDFALGKGGHFGSE